MVAHMLTIRWIGFLLVVFGATSSAIAQAPSLQELRNRAQPIDTSDPELRDLNLDFTLHLDTTGTFVGKACVHSPGRFAVRVGHGANESPILYYAQNQMLIYDPIQGILIHGDDLVTLLKLEADERNFNWAFIIRHRNKNTDDGRGNGIAINVKSLIDIEPERAKIELLDKSELQLSATSPHDTRMLAKFVSVDRRYVLNEWRIEKANDNFSLLVKVSRQPNQQFATVKIPPKTVLETIAQVKNWDNSIESDSEILRYLLLIGEARHAIEDPSLRSTYETAIGHPLDWKTIMENDRRRCEQLRKLFDDH